ncbi:MAG TPA: hypothetical protein VL361_10465 [Candidatus Limnocylindrales bacterium]|nr:hypothetical protein [Candidatus Limnocylindrales bacterium]
MFGCLSRPQLAWLACLAVYLGSGEPLVADTTNLWTNSSSGLWRTGSNWSSGVPPDSTFTYILITNTGTKTVTIDAATPSLNLALTNLTISAPAGSTNTLALVDLTTNLPLQLSRALVVDRRGALYITNSALRATSGLGNFDLGAGSAVLDSGLIDCTAITATRLGRKNTGVGSLTLNGGTMLVSSLQLGAVSGAQGILTVGDGTLNASSLLTVGYAVNSTGMVSVTGGQLLATNDITYVGKSGFGQMTITGGNATFASLSVGNNADGFLSVTGGQLTIRSRTTNDWLQIGNIGQGQFNLSGGTVVSFAELHLGDDSSGFGTGSGTALITGGQLFATNDTTAIGRYGPGQMTVSNALVMLTNVSVGRHDGAVGTLTLQSNAQVFMLDALSIGRFSNSVGHVLLNGGLLSLTNDIIWVGHEGMGDLTISNGTMQARSTFVALSTVVTDSFTMLPVTNVPSGTLTLAGGSLLLTSNLLVGTSAISTGQVSVVGGNLTITSGGSPAYLAVQSGAFALNQGNVTTDSLLLTNSTGQFIFNGGTLQAKSALVSNGLPFVVGDGTHPATFQLLGGTYSFADGLVISDNATVTGCGTILGNISIFGTLATNCALTGVTITATTKTGSTATVYFTTLAGSNHVLEYKNSMTSAVWSAVLPGVIGQGNVTNQADTNATAPSRFYRIHLQ